MTDRPTVISTDANRIPDLCEVAVAYVKFSKEIDKAPRAIIPKNSILSVEMDIFVPILEMLILYK